MNHFFGRKDTEFYRHHQIFKEISSEMDEKSKPTFTGGLANNLYKDLNEVITGAKITTFSNMDKYLVENFAFFNFFLEIEQIIAIFAPTLSPLRARVYV